MKDNSNHIENDKFESLFLDDSLYKNNDKAVENYNVFNDKYPIRNMKIEKIRYV